jgi:lysophospholipase L1-like esterase
MMHRFESDVIDLRARVVVIQAGINDLVAAGLSSERSAVISTQVAANLEDMVHRASTAGIRVVLLTITPPASPDLLRRLLWSARIPSLVSSVNQELMRLHAPPRVYVVDTQDLLQTPAGQWRPNVTADTLHLTPFGYKVLNTAVRDVFAHY